MAHTEITMYGTAWCSDCKRTKKFFGEQRVHYNFVDIDGNAAGFAEFGRAGTHFFKWLVELGLKPEHTLADYGCGTLRVGVHAIKYLEPGRYWGLEVSREFLEEGRKLVLDSVILAEFRKFLFTRIIPNLGKVGLQLLRFAERFFRGGALTRL